MAQSHDRDLWVRSIPKGRLPWEDGASVGAHIPIGEELSFGTGGIRALMGLGPSRLNLLTIGRAAQGLANWLLMREDAPTAVVGYDTRVCSREFAERTACVLAANDVTCCLFDRPQPTPVLDFATRRLGASCGVCITASHNPREYNGFKVYGPDGVQATSDMAASIQEQILAVDMSEDVDSLPFETACERGLIRSIPGGLLESYVGEVLSQRLGIDCSDLSVVYSPLHGTGLSLARDVLLRLGASCMVVESQAEPDGLFPSCPKPNPENLEAMRAGMGLLASSGADLFLATDPDADRVGVACLHDGVPRLLTGNEVGLLLLDYLCRNTGDDADHRVAVTTIVTSPMADDIARAYGVELRRTLTGFKYIGEQVGLVHDEGDVFLIGFEESDGYLRGSYVRDKDGLNGIMLICELAAYHKGRGKDLVEALDGISADYGYVVDRQVSIAFDGATGRSDMARAMNGVRNRVSGGIDPQIECVIDYLGGAPMPVVGGVSGQVLPCSDVLELRLKDGSRVLLRPSGTEPKLKVYVFARATMLDEARHRLDELRTWALALLD